ncbi:MAG: type II toxin-antitoxin system RelE/ParE family toxin [Bacteroidales bacterium]|nr:type II toxin-antitoxin system RelE/ParE family toxin [Bacteroidales bacterium]
MESEKIVFEMVFTEEAKNFLNKQSLKVQNKILYNIHKIQKGEKDRELFKKLEGSDIWEFRTLYNNIAYRLFAFWDTENNTLVIATHGIIKKTQKTPAKEIAKAEQIRKQYFEHKYDK